MSSAEPKTPSLALLKAGLMILDLEAELDEPGYAAIDRQTYGQDVVGKRRSYCTEIERTLDELKLTTQLLSEVEAAKVVGGRTYEPEELITYYSGIFLDLVHQLKDKLLKLVDFMLAEGPFLVAYKEPKRPSPGDLHRKHETTIAEVGLSALLQEWQEGVGPIGLALKHRTNHHHRISTLRYNEDFNRVQVARLMLRPEAFDHLSEFGKAQMPKMLDESLRGVRSEAIRKQQETTSRIEENIDAVAALLIKYFDIPVTPERQAPTIAAYNEHLASVRVTNNTDILKVPDDLLGEMRAAVDELTRTVPGIVAVYAIGSIARGEFNRGASDIALLVITNDLTEAYGAGGPIVVECISRSDLFLDQHKKQRFVCWSDGLLIAGTPVEFDSREFPKPGMALALLLNRGVLDELAAIEADLEDLDAENEAELRRVSLRLARVMLDYDFGVAMSNQPFYSTSRAERIAHTKRVFPGERRTDYLEQVYYRGMLRRDDLRLMFEAAKDSVERTYPKLLALDEPRAERAGES